MTLSEARTELEVLIDKVDQAYFTDAEKDLFLNKAGVEYFDKYYRGFGANQLLRDKLGYFIKERQIRGNAGVAPYDDNTSQYSVIEDYLHLLSASVNGYIAKLVSWEDFQYLSGLNGRVRATQDPYNEPDLESPVITIGPSLQVVSPSDDFNPNAVYYYPHNASNVFGRVAKLTYDLDANGAIVQINILDGGIGYVSGTVLTLLFGSTAIGGPIGSGASATATVINGQIAVINLISGGTGYNNTLRVFAPDPAILTNIASTDTVTISYVREPIGRKITEEFAQLNSSMASEIVQIAARMMTAAIESSNYEVQNNETNL